MSLDIHWNTYKDVTLERSETGVCFGFTSQGELEAPINPNGHLCGFLRSSHLVASSLTAEPSSWPLDKPLSSLLPLALFKELAEE